MVNMPNISSLEAEELTERVVGKDIHLHVHELDSESTTGRVQSHSRRLAREVARDVMKLAGIPEDRDMEKFCSALAAAAMTKLATSAGFTVVYGEYFHPREIVRVDLRPEVTRQTSLEASVQTTVADGATES